MTLLLVLELSVRVVTQTPAQVVNSSADVNQPNESPGELETQIAEYRKKIESAPASQSFDSVENPEELYLLTEEQLFSHIEETERQMEANQAKRLLIIAEKNAQESAKNENAGNSDQIKSLQDRVGTLSETQRKLAQEAATISGRLEKSDREGKIYFACGEVASQGAWIVDISGDKISVTPLSGEPGKSKQFSEETLMLHSFMNWVNLLSQAEYLLLLARPAGAAILMELKTRLDGVIPFGIDLLGKDEAIEFELVQ